MSNELKPCPFCGGEAEICSAMESKFMGKYWYVRCKNCYSRGTGIYESGKELEPNEEYEAIMGALERAIEAWNRRAEGAILNLPPAQPQRTGKWERHYSRPNVYADLCWHCSACGYYHAVNWMNKFKFCPNCGAKMTEGEAE